MIRAYLKEKATLLVPAPPGDWMEKQEPSEVAIRVRANYKNVRVVNPEGEEVTSNINFDMEYNEDIYFDYRIRFKTVEYQIVSIERMQDFSPRFMKVYVK